MFQEGEFAVRGRWARSTLRLLNFPRISKVSGQPFSGNGQICGRQGMTMAAESFSLGFSIVRGCFLHWPRRST